MSAQTARRVLINTTSFTAASFWRIATSFVTQLLVARILGVAMLGEFALMLAWLHIAQVTTEAGLPAWMVRELAGKPEKRRSLWLHVLWLQVALALISASILLALAWLLPAWMPSLAIVMFAALSLPFYAVMSATLALFESAESFHLVFVVDATTNALLLAATALLLWFDYGLLPLFAALAVLQLFAALLALWLLARSHIAPRTDADVSRSTQMSWRATLYASASYFTLSFTDVLQQRADLLILGAVLSPTAIGLYAAASSIVRVAIKLIQAYWRALFPTLSRLHEDETIAIRPQARTDRFPSLASTALRFGALIVVGGSVLLALGANVLTPLLFGNDFSAAAPLLAAMIWSAPFYLWEGYAITLLLVLRSPHSAASITLLHLALLIGALLPLVWLWGALGGAIANVVAAAAGAFLGLWLLRGNSMPSRGVFVRVLLAAALALLAGYGLMQLLAGFLGDSGAVLLGTFVAALVYFALAVGMRVVDLEDVSRIRRSLANQPVERRSID